MGKNKQIYLAGGSEEGYMWSLVFAVSTNQRKWAGFFHLVGCKYKVKQRTINLSSGSEEGREWSLVLNITSNLSKYKGSFHVGSEIRKYRHDRRQEDRQWARKTFPRPWLQQFEIHHSWNCGETCHFLTPEEHHDLHHVTKG